DRNPLDSFDLGTSGYFQSGHAIAVDASGNAFVTGFTDATNFPTTVAFPGTGGSAGAINAFVAKLDAAGGLVYAAKFEDNSTGLGIAVDSAGNAYVTGWASSTNFPTVNALQPVSRGNSDAFVAKINAAGTALVYSTYLGGSDEDFGSSIAVDGYGQA